ncbi:hypothetical protein Tco_0422832 [Tanacetum coccineum]
MGILYRFQDTKKSCHLPIELEHKAYWALKHANFDLKTAGDHRKLQLNELNELRDQAYENSLIYKERTKKLYDSKIKNRIFNVGDRVLLFNSHLKKFSSKDILGEWSSCEALLWRRHTIEGSPGSPNHPHGQLNAGIESSYVTRLPKTKRFDCPDYEDSRARGFVHRSLDLRSSASFWESNIQILSTNVYLLA